MTEIVAALEQDDDGPVFARLTVDVRVAGSKLRAGHVGRVLYLTESQGMRTAVFIYRLRGRKTSRRLLVPVEKLELVGEDATANVPGS